MTMFDRDAVLDRTDLIALANEELGEPKQRGRSARWCCPNPNHAQTGRTPPVTIRSARHSHQTWKCHACHAGGSAIDLIMTSRGLDVRDAIEYLARRAGISEHDEPPKPRPRPPRPSPDRETARPVHAGFQRYVHECAAKLWQPDGAPVHEWITNTRGIPADVLERNRIGADLGARQGRPYGLGVPNGGALVVPVYRNDELVYVQLRLLAPPSGADRWLDPSGRAAPHPRIAVLRPVEDHHLATIIVTEGATDGLSAAAGGYTAAAVLGAGFVHDPSTAYLLSRLPGRLVLAFDPDTAGRNATAALPHYLAAHHRPSTTLDLGGGDLNDHLVAAGSRWNGTLEQLVVDAAAHPPRTAMLTVAR